MVSSVRLGTSENHGHKCMNGELGKNNVHSAKLFHRSKNYLTEGLFSPKERESLARRQMLEEERRRREEAEKRLQDETFHRLQLVEKEVKMRARNLSQVSQSTQK